MNILIVKLKATIYFLQMPKVPNAMLQDFDKQ